MYELKYMLYLKLTTALKNTVMTQVSLLEQKINTVVIHYLPANQLPEQTDI